MFYKTRVLSKCSFIKLRYVVIVSDTIDNYIQKGLYLI